jgi:hypothetical protein
MQSVIPSSSFTLVDAECDIFPSPLWGKQYSVVVGPIAGFCLRKKNYLNEIQNPPRHMVWLWTITESLTLPVPPIYASATHSGKQGHMSLTPTPRVAMEVHTVPLPLFLGKGGDGRCGHSPVLVMLQREGFQVK